MDITLWVSKIYIYLMSLLYNVLAKNHCFSIEVPVEMPRITVQVQFREALRRDRSSHIV